MQWPEAIAVIALALIALARERQWERRATVVRQAVEEQHDHVKDVVGAVERELGGPLLRRESDGRQEDQTQRPFRGR